jgi:hypothetical protein
LQTIAPPKAGCTGDLLLRLLHGRRLEGFERSFKMAEGTLLADRYLVGIQKSEIVPVSLFDICTRIGMPEQYLADCKEQLPQASTIHFGFEGAERGGIFKVYLEFGARLARPRADARGYAGPVLLHLAYKWSAADPALCTVARYHCHPGLSIDAMLARMAELYGAGKERTSFEAARSVINLAGSRCSDPLMYLEVSEEGKPRASFDVNLHEAGIRLHEIEAPLTRLCERYAISSDEFMRVWERVRFDKLGHISGGIDREGGDFFTVYHEAGPK